MKYFIYILYSEVFDKYYIGQTENIEGRLKRHNSGTEKATKPYKPWLLQCVVQKATRAEAMLFEKKLKNLSKARLKIFIKKYSNE